MTNDIIKIGYDLIKFGYVEHDEKNKKVRITHNGKKAYKLLKMLINNNDVKTSFL